MARYLSDQLLHYVYDTRFYYLHQQMKYTIITLVLVITFVSCQKKKYKPYIGNYDCKVIHQIDSLNSGYFFDTTYVQVAQITELDAKNIQFRDLPIPYKYIQESGLYETGHFVPGIYWGREITLRNDSLIYYHYEGTSEYLWSLRYYGRRID